MLVCSIARYNTYPNRWRLRPLLSNLLERFRNTASSAAEPVALPVAATALLLEVAYADQHASESELAQIQQAVMRHFNLDATTVDELLADAANLYGESVGAQPFTRALTDVWDEPQRYALVVSLWRVALAEAGIDPLEEHRIRRIADLLYLSHKRFIQAKLEAKRTTPSS